MVGFDDGADASRILDGTPVEVINADLTGSLDLDAAEPLRENADLSFIGTQKGGAFDIEAGLAWEMLSAPVNPNGRLQFANGTPPALRDRRFSPQRIFIHCFHMLRLVISDGPGNRPSSQSPGEQLMQDREAEIRRVALPRSRMNRARERAEAARDPGPLCLSTCPPFRGCRSWCPRRR